MINESFFIGQPCQFLPGVYVYPPLVREVFGKDYGLYLSLLTYSQEDIEDELLESKKEVKSYPTPLEFLLGNSYKNKNYEAAAKEALSFFLHQKVEFLYQQKKILIGDVYYIVENKVPIESIQFIDEDNFFDLQNLIRASVGKKAVEPPNPNEHPRVKEMKRKARYRDRAKAKQAAKSKDGISLFTLVVSICCMGIGITPLNIGEMSFASLNAIMRKYQEKEKYHIDIDSLLAGADSKKVKPEYWIRNFEE